MQVGELFSTAHSSAASEGRKTLVRQLFECLLLFLFARLGPGFYYIARMDYSGVPLRDVLGYASVTAYNRAVHRVNDATYHRASQHKAIEKAVLSCYRVPTPELIAYLDKRRGRTVGGEPAQDAASVTATLRGIEDGTRLCIKQANSWGGAGFRVITVTEGGSAVIDAADGSRHESAGYFHALLDASPEGAVLERYVDQHPFYASLNASSINSYRIVIWDRDDAPRPWIFAFLRVGRDGALVDNATSGAIICPVDATTGRLEAGFLKYGERVRYAAHPDSSQQLEEVAPPGFDDAVTVALTAVRAFPGISFAGVDVAMSNDGPVVLELNVWPDYSGFAYCRTPSRAAFTDRANAAAPQASERT